MQLLSITLTLTYIACVWIIDDARHESKIIRLGFSLTRKYKKRVASSHRVVAAAAATTTTKTTTESCPMIHSASLTSASQGIKDPAEPVVVVAVQSPDENPLSEDFAPDPLLLEDGRLRVDLEAVCTDMHRRRCLIRPSLRSGF